tara:strand:- start:34960 stop:35484 length:525 start_codon:yes stop_codon:yes gene_type:complete
MANNSESNQHKHKLNDQIMGDEVRLVGDNVENGIISLSQAKIIASELEMDLVLINPTAKPVICKVMDYKKFLYESKKNAKGGQNKAKPVKELRYRPNIDEHDFDFKLKHAKSFLAKGSRVRLKLMFRGREMSFKEQGMALILRVIVELDEYGVAESVPKLVGRNITVIVKPTTN